MKIQTILSITSLCAFTLFSACQNDGTASKDAALQSENALNTAAPAGSVTDPNAQPTETPQNAAGVWHYTCPKGCSGGAGAAVPCATCGTMLTHNQRYHDAAAAPNATTQPLNPSATPGASAPAAQQPEPPQNAAGVWHYTCPGGCSGGAGAAVACATCGKKLEHNKAYHQ